MVPVSILVQEYFDETQSFYSSGNIACGGVGVFAYYTHSRQGGQYQRDFGYDKGLT